MEEYNLYCKFDIQKHKETYKNYLEVIIDEEGSIHYAVPSHQEFLIRKGCNNLKVSREILDLLCPKDFHYDFVTWLCKVSKCIAVWNDRVMGYSFTEAQIRTLHKLKRAGLYSGRVPRAGKDFSNQDVLMILSKIRDTLWCSTKGSTADNSIDLALLESVLKECCIKSEPMEVLENDAYLMSCICPSCGKKLSRGSSEEEKFCEHCGQKLWIRAFTKEESDHGRFEREMDEYED